jgi:hypothetical protein
MGTAGASCSCVAAAFRATCRAALTVDNASTALDFSTGLFPDLSLQECVAVMKEDMRAVNGGNLDKLEIMISVSSALSDTDLR